MANLTNLTANGQAVVKIFASVFKAGVSNDLISQGAALLDGGMTKAQLYSGLLTNSNIQAAFPLYTSVATSAAFVGALVDNVFANSGVATAYLDAVKTNWTTRLDTEYAGARGTFMDALLSALMSDANATSADTNILAVYNTINNRAEVGATNALSGASPTFTTMSALQTQTATVTNDSATIATAVAATVTGGTFALTTAIDASVGTSGNDTFNASIVGSNATGSTINPGDNVNGSSGTDTVNIAASSAAAGVVAAVTFVGIEKVLVSDFNTGGSSSVDMSLADADLTTVGLSSSDTAGTLSFTGLKKVVNAEMKNGGNGLTLTFASGNTGTADVVNLAVSGQTASTFTADGIETISVASSVTKSDVTLVGAQLATVNVTGDTEVSVTLPSTVKTVDASAATGKVTVAAAAIDLTTVTSYKGGAGTTDVIDTTTNITKAADLSKVSGFEVLKSSGAASTVTLASDVTGLTTFDFTNSGDQILTLSTGYTAATTVKITGDATTNQDKVVNTANVALTVVGNVADFDTGTSITGGTGTDALTMTADGGAAVLTNVAGVETITITANTTTPSSGATLSAIASATGKTVTIDASALTNASAAVSITGTASNAGKLAVTGGAGNDTINLNASTAANTVSGGAGNDGITAGAGNDSIAGGAGNDTITMGANLTANDTIDGGDGTDTLTVSSLTSGAGFANVTNVETIGITGTTSASLSSAIGTSVTFDLADTAVQSLTLNTGYTGTTTVKMGATGVDAVTNNANVALTATGVAANFNAASVVGGTGTDVITMSADGTSVSLANVSGVETITVTADSTSATNGVTLTTGASTVAATKSMTVDASALSTTAVLTFAGAATAGTLSVTGGAGNDVIASGDKAATIIGGAGNDQITASDTASINDNISGGDGNDTITFNSGAGTLDFNDTVDGGAGTDTLVVGTPVSGMLAKVTNVEVLQLGASGAFGSEAVGFNTFDLTTTGNQVLTLSAGFTGDTTVKMATTGAVDGVVNSANVALTMTGNGLAFHSAVITGGTGTDTIKLTADGGAGGITVAGTSIDAITVLANTTTASTDTGTITLAATTIATGKTLTVDATALTDSGADLTITGANTTTTGKMSVTGGAGNDVVTGTGNADTILGGSGDDSISGGAGLDVLTGGAGNDVFVVSANANGLTMAQITDFTSGDAVRFGTQITGQPSLVVPAKMTLAAGATTLSDYINAATAGDGNTNSIMKWFQFGGNTYMVVDNNSASTFTTTTAGTADLIVQLNGEIDLTSSIIAASASQAEWVLGTTATSVPGGLTAGTFALANAATDSLVGGAGVDTFTEATADNLTSGDTIAGGAGNDIISMLNTASSVDADFTNVTSVEQILLGADGTLVLSSLAQAAGINTVTTGATTAAITASGMTTGLTIDAAAGAAVTMAMTSGADKFTGAAGAVIDTLTFGANLSSADTVAGGGGTDVIKVSGTLVDTAFTNVTAVETLDLTAASNVTLGAFANTSGFSKVTNSGNGGVTVNTSAAASVITITGGTGVDTITSGATAVTITGGASADSITLGAANAVVDTLVWATGGGLDVVTNFLQGAGGDQLNAGISTGGAAATVVSSADGTTAISMAGTDEVLVLRTADGTFADLAAVSTRLQVASESFAASDTYYVVWTATTGGLTHISLLTTDAGNTVISGADTLEDMVTLVGTTNSTAITLANFATVA